MVGARSARRPGSAPCRRLLRRARPARRCGHGRGLPGGHRRRSALCRHGALRQEADPRGVVLAGAAGPADQLLRARRAAADDPGAAENPFFLLAPDWAVLPLVALATAAAIIASQALISGVFSLTRQAIQLGYCPRLDIDHTSSAEIGQVYVPQANWALMVMHDGHRHRLRLVECPGRRLRHRRHADDGDHRRAAARGRHRAVGLAAARWCSRSPACS